MNFDDTKKLIESELNKLKGIWGGCTIYDKHTNTYSNPKGIYYRIDKNGKLLEIIKNEN